MKVILCILIESICFSLFAQMGFRSHVAFLAADSLQGRAPGTIYEQKAANYICHFWEENQVKTDIQAFSFPTEKTDTAYNVIGQIAVGKAKTILITAHYDHLGWGNKKSREIIHNHQIHNGADDNASGVAMMLELAKTLAAQKDSLRYNYVFVAYSAHELGLYGSQFFAESDFCKKLNIRCVLNFDMVGRLNQTMPILRVGGTDSDATFRPFFEKYESDSLHFRLADEQVLYSDIKFLYEKKIPTLTFTTGIHEDYHRASDDIEKINYKGMERIFLSINAFLQHLQE